MSLGRSGEEEFGQRHFIELVAVFSTPPMFKVRHGRQDVGEVDPLTFVQMTEEPGYILLAGRSWRVNHIDWRRWVAHVEPVEATGKSKFPGGKPQMSYELAQAYKGILMGDEIQPCWSNRTQTVIEECRRDFNWMDAGSTVLTIGDSNHPEWWTFAGSKGNATLAAGISQLLECDVKRDDPFFLRIQTQKPLEEIHRAIESLQNADWSSINPAVNEAAITGLKFNACMPDQWAQRVLQDRLKNVGVAKAILDSKLRIRVS